MIEETKQKIDKLVQQKRNIESQLTTLQQEYHRLLCKNIQVGNIYKTHEDAYIKVLDVSDYNVDILRIDDQIISWDWYSKECISNLKQLTELPKDISDTWKSRGIKL